MVCAGKAVEPVGKAEVAVGCVLYDVGARAGAVEGASAVGGNCAGDL